MKKLLKVAIILCLFYAVVAMAVTLLQTALLIVHNPHNTAWMRLRARQAQAAGKPFTVRQAWMPLKNIPLTLRKAVVAAEDEKFYQHRGFDWDALKQAYTLNEKRETIKRGGSTITQQLAKNLYLSPDRSYVRKAREAVITATMELLLSKERILELYLNCIEFGPGIFGVEEGARFHFGVSVKRLSLEQSCRLAAIIPSPLRYRVTGEYVGHRAGVLARIVGGTSTLKTEGSTEK